MHVFVLTWDAAAAAAAVSSLTSSLDAVLRLHPKRHTVHTVRMTFLRCQWWHGALLHHRYQSRIRHRIEIGNRLCSRFHSYYKVNVCVEGVCCGRHIGREVAFGKVCTIIALLVLP